MTQRIFSSEKALKEFESRVRIHVQTEAANDLGPRTLKVIDELLYLHGCVKRGRGADIDAEHPGKNVFEYIKELESQIGDNCKDGACGVCNNCRLDPLICI